MSRSWMWQSESWSSSLLWAQLTEILRWPPGRSMAHWMHATDTWLKAFLCFPQGKSFPSSRSRRLQSFQALKSTRAADLWNTSLRASFPECLYSSSKPRIYGTRYCSRSWMKTENNLNSLSSTAPLSWLFLDCGDSWSPGQTQFGMGQWGRPWALL